MGNRQLSRVPVATSVPRPFLSRWRQRTALRTNFYDSLEKRNIADTLDSLSIPRAAARINTGHVLEREITAFTVQTLMFVVYNQAKIKRM